MQTQKNIIFILCLLHFFLLIMKCCASATYEDIVVQHALLWTFFCLFSIRFDSLYYCSFPRKNELHQVAQQASNIEDLTDVIRTSISVMSKQWSDALHTFQEKFNSLSTLIIDYGNRFKVKQIIYVIFIKSFVCDFLFINRT